MSPAVVEGRVGKFQGMVDSGVRVGVSEFARSKSWREQLPAVGCFEVVDRGGVVGYMLAPEYARAVSDRLVELEEQAEQAQIAAMFNARRDYTDIKTGKDLAASSLEYFDKNIDALLEIVDGD